MSALRATLAVTVLAALLALAAGCGDDEETTVTETETVPATEAETGAETTAETETTETTSSEGKRGPAFFSTPSGNIACHIGAKSVRCDIAERDWKPTPPPEPCELDYGNGIVLDLTHAEFTCAGDTTLGAPKKLAYGSSAQRGPFVCESEPDGVTCSHTGDGHGFFLSRQSFRIF